MMGLISSRTEKGRRWLREPRTVRRLTWTAQGLGYLLLGAGLSAAALGSGAVPFCMGLLLAMPVGWPVLLTALGSSLGYWLFWGSAGLRGQLWTAAGLMVSGLLGGRKIVRQSPLLMPALGTLIVSAVGLGMQVFLEDETPVALYLLQVALGWGSTWLTAMVYERRSTWVDWLAEAAAILALAQIRVTPWLGLGYVAAAALGSGGSFPAAVLGGLALDLSGITRTPMTAVLSLCCGMRLAGRGRGLRWLFPTGAYLAVSALCSGLPRPEPLAGLLLGGLLGLMIPARRVTEGKRGSIGIAQVKLELAAEVMAQVKKTLLLTRTAPVDEQAIVTQAVQRACDDCPCQKGCRDRTPMAAIPTALLHRPHLQSFHVPVPCRKVGRVAEELRRGQEQLRSILAERENQAECREAVLQQYGFLSSFLTALSEDLPLEEEPEQQKFHPEVAVCSVGKELSNGDRCLWFAGRGCRYYVLLCDGMGTGLGASQEAKAAGVLLRDLLSAGFPAEHALRSLNSLCALRSRAGAVTVDLAEVRLDTGEAVLYKWGAMPSYLLDGRGAEKIGTAGAPPGLSVTQGRETADRLSLGRGQTLVMLSDGVDGEEVLRRAGDLQQEPPGEAAASILEEAERQQPDDATAVVIRLCALLPGQQ